MSRRTRRWESRLRQMRWSRHPGHGHMGIGSYRSVYQATAGQSSGQREGISKAVLSNRVQGSSHGAGLGRDGRMNERDVGEDLKSR